MTWLRHAPPPEQSLRDAPDGEPSRPQGWLVPELLVTWISPWAIGCATVSPFVVAAVICHIHLGGKLAAAARLQLEDQPPRVGRLLLGRWQRPAQEVRIMRNDATAWAWPWWTVMVLINAVNLMLCVRVFLRTAGSRRIEQSRLRRLVATSAFDRSVAITGDNLYGNVARRRATSSSVDELDWKYRKWMCILGATFTIVGAYRSVFVSRYSTQMAWFDTLANSSLLIRGFALFAEVSFSGQFALALIHANRDLSIAPAAPIARLFAQRAPYVLWGCIILAQVFATTGVITKSELTFAIEETLWSIGFLTVLPLAILQLRRASAMRDSGRFDPIRRFALLNVLWCAVYCTWGICLNLPTVWLAAMHQIRTGMPEIRLGLSAVKDALLIVHESKAWGDWGFGFLFWHSNYFSVCVWLSLFLMSAPRARQDGPDQGTGRRAS